MVYTEQEREIIGTFLDKEFKFLEMMTNAPGANDKMTDKMISIGMIKETEKNSFANFALDMANMFKLHIEIMRSNLNT